MQIDIKHIKRVKTNQQTKNSAFLYVFKKVNKKSFLGKCFLESRVVRIIQFKLHLYFSSQSLIIMSLEWSLF